ncbi:MAG: 3-deoxy-D-manno-octulosonic acid transferase [Paracoccaceae bacterium]|nr:MAG: 3-deoxy-D-manno-octulosonic acid transferase [Paracoccaceae bacterium]
MAYSLGLTLYMMRARAPAGPVPPHPPRPAGPVIWLHGSDSDARRALLALAPRLTRGAAAAVVLTAEDEAPPTRLPPGVTADAVPADAPAPVRGFLDHWRPSVALLAGGVLRPALIHAAQERSIPLVMAEAREPSLPRDRAGWWPGLVRGLLAGFHAVLAVDEPAARVFRKAGAPPSRVESAGRMEQPSAALTCTEAERAALARLLATRPVWLAAALPEAEETTAIEAHRRTLRLAHRLLLIVAPDQPERAAPLADRMEKVEGWTVARRWADDEPDSDVQVLVTDSLAEMGLWLRLAPLTYLGGSLTPGGCRFDPMAAAALGSAILHGPRAGDFGGAIGRLAAAQASALVGSAADLAQTLGELLAPDRAARLAQAAWAVASDGGEVSDRIAAMLLDLARGQG